ncbi:CotH kinase family protein [Archangium violaceum]|uniref:CotH kinase family protein n=1 Tax=Archangium violaceum TaxID=83451 RepID=UPI00194FA595|nr:CotH kinase family protein [Archangium violaceum]QRN98778.1 CotH kinase family protein [Archangium violaceum]
MRLALLTGLLLLLGACGGPSDPPDTHPHTTDDIDNGKPDGGSPSEDAGRPDAGRPPDAGTPDAGSPDAGSPPDGGTQTGSRPSPSKPRWPALQTSIPTYELSLSQRDYDALYAHIPDPPSKEFKVLGHFLHEGRTYAVELSFRGRSTKTDPRVVKKSWDVRFDKEDRFQGRKNIELLAAWKDSGYLTEKLWYDLAASVGLRVPYARYAHVKLHLRQDNGTVITKYEGVFTELESINKDFLEAHDFDDDGDIYRCGMHDCEMRQPPQEHYQESWDKKTNEKQPWDSLWSFLEGVNRTPPHRFSAFVQEKLEVEDYLTWLAVDAFIANDLQGDSRSYLVHDPKTGRWTYVPWDLNNSLSLYNRTNAVIQGVKGEHALFSYTPYDPNVYDLWLFRRSFPDMQDMKPTWSTLTTRLYDDPALRARYVARLRLLLDTWLTEENIGPRVDAMHKLLAPYILPGKDGKTVDPYVSPEHAARSADYLHRFVSERREWLRQHLHDIESLGNGALVIDRVGRDASGAFWVQLYNRGSTPVSLSGLHLTGFTRQTDQWTLPSISVEPKHFVTFRQGAAGIEGLGATLDPQHPEVALYSADQMTALDLLWLAPLKPGEAYGRQPRGAESFGSQPGP